VRQIFDNAQTSLKQPKLLRMLVTSIDGLDWYSAKEEGLGDLYEGLLEKNASEKKSGAGQYFTPRVLIDAIVRVMEPQPVEVIQDPAAETGGFLIAADRHIKKNTDQLFTLRTETQNFQKQKAFQGVELVQDAHRLLMMNLLLHGIESEVKLGDSLGVEGVDGGEMGRLRRFSRGEIHDRSDSLDISWLRDENEERSEDLPEPEVLAAAVMDELKGAIEELSGILAELAVG
jgi:type I restriction-modification system DNA methylase subunit